MNVEVLRQFSQRALARARLGIGWRARLIAAVAA
jgi:hypothetical protein